MANRTEISTKPNVYGWSAMVDFTVNGHGGFKEIGDSASSLLWARDLILTLKPRQIHPIMEGAGARGYRMIIEAADTAASAENLGLRLAGALLTVAIVRNWGMSLSWPDQPLPCRVIDRNASAGISVQGFASSTNHMDAENFINDIDTAFKHEFPYRVLLSMELCASSRMEYDNRAKLILLVSAFETLAEQQDLTDKIGPLVKQLKSEIVKSKLDDSLKSTLSGQVNGLRRESVRRSINRLMNELDIDHNDRNFVDEAYSARSKIVHEGSRFPGLDAMTGKLDAILRKMYAKLLQGV